MADHSQSTPNAPDYPLDDYRQLDAEQIRTLIEPTRKQIVDLLTERAATVSQLADALDRPKGTIDHHAKALEAAGLITVVRTEKVRAIEAKYYGRTARTFLLTDLGDVGADHDFMLRDALVEMEKARAAGMTEAAISSVRYARISVERAQEWHDRLAALINEFVSQERGGETVYGAAVALFPTTRPALGDR
jgi:DNA-binding transcriptional ArsR family regulator